MGAPPPRLDQALREQRLLVCVGSGGVGKTTTAAALGIQGALMGRRTLVITIDPARRLANSLGLQELGNEERAIPRELFVAAGHPEAASLHAMMLDTRTAFDEVIRRVSPNEATRQRVLHNRVYRHMSESLSASQEYMASETLWDAHHSGKYDLIVLDTPPMKNAIDFLEASGRLTRFLDDKIMKWFMTPYEEGMVLGKRLVLGTSALAFRLLGNIFGKEFLEELSEFFQSFRELYRGFRERSEGVSALLRDPVTTRFVVVTSPQPTTLEEALFFTAQLREKGMPGGLFIVNQMGRFQEIPEAFPGTLLSAMEREALDALPLRLGGTPDEARAFTSLAVSALKEAREHSAADAERIETLRGFAGQGSEIRTIPRFPQEVHDFASLLLLGEALIQGQGEARPRKS